MPCFGHLRPGFEETVVVFKIITKFVKMQSFTLKRKNINLVSKMSYLGIFRLEFEKTIVTFEISTHEFIKTEFLTKTINFGIGSVVSKSSGSTFSEGPGPGLGPLHKLCCPRTKMYSLVILHMLTF